MYRQDRFRQDLVYEQAAEVVAIEERLFQVDQLLALATSRGRVAPAQACPQCGAPVFPGARFCASCGNALAAPQPSSAEGPHGTCPRCGTSAAPGPGVLPRVWPQASHHEQPLRAPPQAVVRGACAVVPARPAPARSDRHGSRGRRDERRGGTDAHRHGAPRPRSRADDRARADDTAPATAPPLPTTSIPSTPTQQRPIDWPDQDGYTIVLESIPTSSSRQRALETARRAIRAGLADVGVLASSNYASLQPGYYVVFTGVYDSTAAAVDALPAANDAGFQAYVRPVSR